MTTSNDTRAVARSRAAQAIELASSGYAGDDLRHHVKQLREAIQILGQAVYALTADTTDSPDKLDRKIRALS